MTLQETQRYVRSQLLQLGWGPNPVITRQAWELIYAQTRGNQDTLDQLCNRLASLGKPGENHKITKDAVKIAIRELKVFNELPPIPVLGDDSEPLLEDGNRGRDSDAISIEQLRAAPEAKARVGFDPASPPSFEALLGAVEKAGYRAEIADQSVDESKNPSRSEEG